MAAFSSRWGVFIGVSGVGPRSRIPVMRERDVDLEALPRSRIGPEPEARVHKKSGIARMVRSQQGHGSDGPVGPQSAPSSIGLLDGVAEHQDRLERLGGGLAVVFFLALGQ